MKITSEILVGAAVALVLGLLLGWAGRGLITYPANSATITAYQDWHLACPAAIQKAGSCQISDDILDSKSREEVARLVVGKDKDKLMMGVTLPLAVLLPPGIGLIIGKEPIKAYAFRTCNNVSCVAILPVDAKMLVSLRAAKDASIRYMGLDGKIVALSFSMNGFLAAQNAFDHNETRRKSWFWRMWS